MILNPIIMILKAPIHYVVNLGRHFFFGLNNENWRINFQLHWAVGNVGMETHQVLKAMDGQPL